MHSPMAARPCFDDLLGFRAAEDLPPVAFEGPCFAARFHLHGDSFGGSHQAEGEPSPTSWPTFASVA